MRNALIENCTHSAALIIENDPHDHEMISQWARDALEDWATPDEALCDLAEILKAHYGDTHPLEEEPTSIYSELLSLALGNVEWRDIAEGFIELAKE